MDKREAIKISKQLQARFDVYFKNNYVKHAGKHWRTRKPEDPATIARNSIRTNCDVVRSGKVVSFRFSVGVTLPKFVEPTFRIRTLARELEHFFQGNITRVTDETVDLRRKGLYFMYQDKASEQYFSFNFQVK